MNKITPTTSPPPTPNKLKNFQNFFLFNDILRKFLRGWGLATFTLNTYKIAHTSLGKSCILCFETVLGMNKITPAPLPPPKIKKVFQKNFFYFMIFLKNFFKGVGFLINYNMVRGLPGRSCLKSFNIIKKTSSLP